MPEKCKAIVCCLVLCFMAAEASAEAVSRSAVRNLAHRPLAAPADARARDYLGGVDGRFELAQVAAPVLIVEIFSMYCPYCQREAPTVNRLYDMIESEPDLAGSIKIVGVGAGNSDFEVDFFRESYRIIFPLLSDKSGDFVKDLGDFRTPLFIVMRIDKGEASVLFTHTGGFGDPAAFLRRVIDKAWPGGEAIRTLR